VILKMPPDRSNWLGMSDSINRFTTLRVAWFEPKELVISATVFVTSSLLPTEFEENRQ
jgi:hypothetical protein